MFTIENKASCSAKEDAIVSHSEAETIIQDLRWDVEKRGPLGCRVSYYN